MDGSDENGDELAEQDPTVPEAPERLTALDITLGASPRPAQESSFHGLPGRRHDPEDKFARQTRWRYAAGLAALAGCLAVVGFLQSKRDSRIRLEAEKESKLITEREATLQEESLKELAAWRSAMSPMSIGSLKSYLAAYPTSPNAQRAQELLKKEEEKIAWQELQALEDTYHLSEFLNRFPKSKHAEEVQHRMREAKAWEIIIRREGRQNVIERLLALDDYLTAFPEGRHAAQVMNRASQILHEIDRQADTRASICLLRQYLAPRPIAPFAAEAYSLLARKLASLASGPAISLVRQAIADPNAAFVGEVARTQYILMIQDELSSMGFSFGMYDWLPLTITTNRPDAYVRFQQSLPGSPMDTPLSVSRFSSGESIVIANIDWRGSPTHQSLIEIGGQVFFAQWLETRDTRSGELQSASVSANRQYVEIRRAPDGRTTSARYTFLADLTAETTLLPLTYGVLGVIRNVALNLNDAALDLNTGILAKFPENGETVYSQVRPEDVGEYDLAAAIAENPPVDIVGSRIWRWFDSTFGESCGQSPE